MKHLIIFAFLAILASCSSESRTQTQTRTVGVQAGQEVNLSTTSTTFANENSGFDISALVTSVVQASQGKILGALEAIRPQPVPIFPSVEQISSAVSSSIPQQRTDWGTTAGGGVAAALGLFLAWQKSREKKEIELDRDKTYDDYIDVCKKAPPESLRA